MNIASQYFMNAQGGCCILFQVNWDWNAVLFGETNQKKMTRMVHSFCFHPALNMLPHHPSLANMSKCFVWQGSACHQDGCNWVLVCDYTLSWVFKVFFLLSPAKLFKYDIPSEDRVHVVDHSVIIILFTFTNQYHCHCLNCHSTTYCHESHPLHWTIHIHFW